MKKITSILLITISIIGFTKAQSVGDDAPDFTVSTIDDSSFALSDNSGKVIFIFFFWIGCPYCQAVAPETESEIYQEFKNHDDFEMIAIEVLGSSKEQATSFASQYGMTYTVAYGGESVANNYGTSYDNAVLIDKNGKIAYETTGGHGSLAEDLNTISNTIQDLLDIPTSINENLKDNISVAAYPNPFTNRLEIQYSLPNASAPVNVRVYSVSGKMIEQLTLQTSATGNNTIKLNTENWQQGFYYIQLNQQHKVHHLKVLKRSHE